MNSSEEDLQKLYAAMSHPVRRKILWILRRKGKASFSDLMNELDIPETGKLSYHLTQMQPLVNQDHEKRYYLSRLGNLAITIEQKALEELEIQGPSSIAPKPLYWMIIGMCGVLGWLIAWVLYGFGVASYGGLFYNIWGSCWFDFFWRPFWSPSWSYTNLPIQDS